jgi:hypothetical protein
MDLFPFSGEWKGTITLLGPLEKANLDQLPIYISITTAMCTYTLETWFCEWEEKFTVKIVITQHRHANQDVSPASPEDVNRFSFRNVVFFFCIFGLADDGRSQKNPVILNKVAAA